MGRKSGKSAKSAAKRNSTTSEKKVSTPVVPVEEPQLVQEACMPSEALRDVIAPSEPAHTIEPAVVSNAEVTAPVVEAEEEHAGDMML